MYIDRKNRNSDTWWLVTSYKDASAYHQGFSAEICSDGNIKIALDEMDLTQQLVSEEDLALFYQYNEEAEAWVPLIYNGRLL